jgi:precorrin-2 methylase
VATLTVVGTGIAIGEHLTPQARVAFERADESLYLVGDPVAATFLEQLNPRARSLHTLYGSGKPRLETYEEMVEEILSPLRAGRSVCAAFYGHPAVFVYPGQHAVTRAREEGFRAFMLPGISSLDCLWCDLGIDPAAAGCQIYPATEFILERRVPDTAATLVLLQINVIGVEDDREQPDWSRLPVLVDYLREFYPADHEVIGYEAPPYPIMQPVVERSTLGELVGADLRPGMTLVVPPATEAAADRTMAQRLGMEPGT